MAPLNPDPEGFPTFRPQYPIRASDLKRVAEQAAQATRAAATGGVADVGAGGGLQIGEELLPDGFWARITSAALSMSQTLYSWVEVIDDGTGHGWTAPNGGNAGTFSAFEINGNANVSGDPVTGPIVWMSPLAVAGFYKFEWLPGTSPITINNTTLNFTNDTFNFTTDVFNYFSDTFNFYNINNFYIQNNSWVIFNFPITNAFDVGGVIFNLPIEICGYLFACCTTWSQAGGSNALLPAVLSPGGADTGAVVYDVTSTTGPLDGITPQGMGPQINLGPVTAATNATPIVLTVPAGFSPAPGSIVVVKNVLGNTAANGVFTVQAATATTITLANSTGNGAFAASPNSAVQNVGPSLIALTGAITITDQSFSGSRGFARIFLPPAYLDGVLNQVVLGANDSIILWWDACQLQAWKVLACTVPALLTKNVDNTQKLQPTYQITANNTLGTAAFGRIKFTTTSALNKVNQLDWQGIRAYSAGVGLVGPEPDIEIDGDTCPTGSSQTIGVKLRDDVANQRVVVSLYTIGDTAVIDIPVATGGTVNSDCSITLTYSHIRLTFNCGLFEGSSGFGQSAAPPLVSGQNTATQAAIDPSITQPPPDLFGGSGHNF